MARIFSLLAAATIPFQAIGFLTRGLGSNLQINSGITVRSFSALNSQGFSVCNVRASYLKLQAAESSSSSEAKEETKPTGHSPPAGHGVPEQEISEEAQAIQMKIREHQQSAARISKPEEVRTLVEYSTGFGVMSTISKDFGFPAGSVVGFALDEGLPFFVFSGMSQHTQDILVDPRFSLTITSKDFKGAQDGRTSLMGEIEKVPQEDVERLKELYLKKHPDAFWVNFGDFNYFRMKELKDIRFVGGFAIAGGCTPEEYLKAQPDPVAAYSSHVIGHMNEDHADATAAMVKHYICGCDVENAEIVSMDSLGMSVKVTIMGDTGKLRLPFIRKVEDRKDLKNIIVEMTQASAEA